MDIQKTKRFSLVSKFVDIVQSKTGWSYHKVVQFGYGVLVAFFVVAAVSVYMANRARKKCEDKPQHRIIFMLLALSVGFYLVSYFHRQLIPLFIPVAIGLNFSMAYIAHKYC